MCSGRQGAGRPDFGTGGSQTMGLVAKRSRGEDLCLTPLTEKESMRRESACAYTMRVALVVALSLDGLRISKWLASIDDKRTMLATRRIAGCFMLMRWMYDRWGGLGYYMYMTWMFIM